MDNKHPKYAIRTKAHAVLMAFMVLVWMSNPYKAQSSNPLSDIGNALEMLLAGKSNAQIRLQQAVNMPFEGVDSAQFYFAKGLLSKINGERNAARGFFLKAQHLANITGDSQLQLRAKAQLGVMYREERDFVQAMPLLEEAHQQAIFFGDTLHTVLLMMELGHAWFQQGRNAMALHHYTKAKASNESLDNQNFAANIDRAIGSTYLKLGLLFRHINKEKASNYFEEAYRYNLNAFAFFEQSNEEYGQCICKMNMLEASINLDDYPLANTIFTQATNCIGYPDNEIQLRMRMLAAALLVHQSNTDDAVKLLDEAMVLKFRFLAPVNYHEAYLQLAGIYRNIGMVDTAYSMLVYAASWFDENGHRLKAFEAFNILSEWFEHDDKLPDALEANKKAAVLKNLLVDEADMEIFDELRHKYQTDILEDELLKAQENERIRRKQLLLLLILAVLIGLVMIMALVFLSMKRNKALLLKELAEEKAAKSAEESKAKRLALEQVETAYELTLQKASANKLLAEKNEQEILLNTLREAEMLNFQKDMLGRLLPFVTKFSRKTDRDTFETLLSELRHESDSDPMTQFETVFKQAHGDFYTKLVEKAPDITRAEIQIAVLLRLNLTSKEIAHILNLTTATIERTRHQLRQKLQLEPSQQLVAWLMGLG